MRDYFSVVMDETEEKGREEGREEGMSQGEIVGTIKTMRQFKVSDEEIEKSIVNEYHITLEVAHMYLSEDGGKYNALRDEK